MLNYRWPGNSRELKNVVERSVYCHGTSDYPLDDIIIDLFKRRPPEDAIAVSETNSLPNLPLDLRESQWTLVNDLLQLSL
ncbi:Phage shock protein F [Escherichia coli]|nr:Phage shock protein F [Escherichia coli]